MMQVTGIVGKVIGAIASVLTFYYPLKWALFSWTRLTARASIRLGGLFAFLIMSVLVIASIPEGTEADLAVAYYILYMFVDRLPILLALVVLDSYRLRRLDRAEAEAEAGEIWPPRKNANMG